MTRETIFSPCRKWRYTLWREFDSVELFDGCNDGERGRDSYVQFIGLNPSTADEVQDDPTIRRCIAFAKAWGFGAYCMTNIFAWRDTLPQNMKRASEPIGADNDKHLVEIAKRAGLVVAAWGNHGEYLNRGTFVRGLLSGIAELKCFRITSNGQPEHPLYQRAGAQLIDYKP